MGFYDINKMGGFMPFGGASFTGMSPSMPDGLSLGSTPAASTNYLSQGGALDSFTASPWGGFDTTSPFMQSSAPTTSYVSPLSGFDMSSLTGTSTAQPFAGMDMSNLTGVSTSQPFVGLNMPSTSSTPVGLASYTPPIPTIGQTGTANTSLTGFTPTLAPNTLGTDTTLPTTGTTVPATGTTVPTASSMDTASAMQAFESYGWTPAQAAGIVANLQKSGGPDQWSADRQAKYTTFAKANGLQNTDAQSATPAEQYAFINYELTQGDKKSTGTALKAAKTPQDAAKIFAQGYGIPAGMKDDSELEDIASQLFAGLGNTDDSMPLGLDTPTGGTDNSGGTGDPTGGTGGNMTPTSPTGGSGGTGGSDGGGDSGGNSDPGNTDGVGDFVVDTSANISDAQSKIADAAASHVGKSMWAGLLGSGNLGCAASVSNILNGAGVLKHKMNAINVGTEEEQLKENGFVKLKPGEKPQPGDVWIGRGGPSDGHTGIIGKGGVQYDNHSSTGKWSKESGNYFSKWHNNVFYRKVK